MLYSSIETLGPTAAAAAAATKGPTPADASSGMASLIGFIA